jgi:hypothetical protein
MRFATAAVAFAFVVSVLGGTLRAEDSAAATPFNGKDLSGWKVKDPGKSHWKIGKATLDTDKSKIKLGDGGTDLVNASGSGTDISTEAKYGDCLIEVEVFVPKGSNSGIYVMGEYEVQVFDSYGKTKLGQGDMGAIYSAAAAKVNASRAPGEWQKYVIDFRAPKFDDNGKKTSPATFVKVTLNDQVIHENVTMKAHTPGGLTGKESSTGPLMFQGDHGAIAYRNIKITPVKDK